MTAEAHTGCISYISKARPFALVQIDVIQYTALYKTGLKRMFKEVNKIDAIIDRLGIRLKPLSSIDFDAIFESNKGQTIEAIAGNKKAINFLMGQIMKNNNIDPAGAKELLIKKLGER